MKGASDVPAIPQINVTPEVIQDWTDQVTEQIQSGWSFAQIRRQLTRAGCPPDVLEKVMKAAKKNVSGEQRRGGVVSLGVGAALVAAAVAIVLVQGTGGTVLLPSGLFLAGLISFGRGVLKTLFG